MLDYFTLKLKPIVTKELSSGESIEYKDLLSKVINKGTVNMFYEYRIVEVTDDYIARPDLISLAVYGTDKYADIICKINGISNPFELNTGMKLIIPSESNFSTLLKVGKPTETLLKNNSIGGIVSNNQKLRNEKRSPGEQTVGDYLFKIDRDNCIIYY
jgi:hypothetical protein